MDETTTEETTAPRRGRPPRAEAETVYRRRRTGILDTMRYDKLNPFADGMLDHETYLYRWQSDESGQLRALTQRDDWDFVTADDVPGFDASQLDCESDGRLRIVMNGVSASSPDAIHGYFIRKRRDFWNEDRAQISEFYESMMEGRVYEGQSTGDDDMSVRRAVEAGVKVGRQDASTTYALKTNQLGGPTRRRGPVTRSL